MYPLTNQNSLFCMLKTDDDLLNDHSDHYILISPTVQYDNRRI
jgi:hypothetical protein